MYNWQRGWQTVEIIICRDKLQQSHRKYRNAIWLEWGQKKSHTVKCHAGETAEKNVAIRKCLIVVIIDGKKKPSEIKVLCSQSLGCLFGLLRACCKKESLFFFFSFGSVETHCMKVLVAQNRTLESKNQSLGKRLRARQPQECDIELLPAASWKDESHAARRAPFSRGPKFPAGTRRSFHRD